ncbi:MAG TPA: hypothetical protein VGS01_09645 [Candidatus Limnocylindria bacterium]|jgi:hypothetical protein|nr:hypothetical protein [Candidatus Limnocylindria bacterium]
MARTETASVYVFTTEYEGNTETTVYASEERAQKAALDHIRDWFDHEERSLGIDAIWSHVQPDRLDDIKDKAGKLYPILDALNHNDADRAIALYNDAGEEHDGDWSCRYERTEVQR